MNYKSLEEISSDVKKCKKCDLYKTRNNSVPGKGKKRNKIIFVGEAPGAEEDEKGIPFCGRGGKLLRKSIRNKLNSSNSSLNCLLKIIICPLRILIFNSFYYRDSRI